MRGVGITQEPFFSYRTLEERIPKDHPLRKLRAVVDILLATMSSEFNAFYARPEPVGPRLHRSGCYEPA